MKHLLIALGALVLVPIMLLYSAFSSGFILFKFWYWFILPVFPTLPAISIWEAVALNTALLAVKTAHSTKYSLNGAELKSEPQYVVYIFFPWILLLIGWFIHLFI